MTVEELRNKLISEAQSCWNKLNITKRVSGSEFSYYDGYIDCGFIKEEQIQIDAEQIRALQKQNGELTDKVKELKILISSLVYEINQIWDINEMNDDLRRCAEKIDREVQLSKMAEDNRIVISALGFAIVPPKPKLDAKEIKEK